MNKEYKELVKRLETEISKTPTGDLRNLLCDANIVIQTLIKDDELTSEQINDLMVTALEGGINYWCGHVTIKEGTLTEEQRKNPNLKYITDVISMGGTLIFHDIESDDTWELTKEKFLKGLEKTLEWGNFNSVEDMFENHDAETADVLIQYALFDEIVFG